MFLILKAKTYSTEHDVRVSLSKKNTVNCLFSAFLDFFIVFNYSVLRHSDFFAFNVVLLFWNKF